MKTNKRTNLFPAHESCAGIYLHIPFCVKKCDYCDFLSAPASKNVQQAYLKQLNRELLQICKRMQSENQQISTVYFGGGTPSILPGEAIVDLMQTITRSHLLREDAEITLELNPGTVSQDKLAVYRQAGINRLSIGAQSFRDEELKRLGRIHTCQEFLDAYQAARQCGFDQISLDLMSGLPGQTAQQWRENLEMAVSLEPEHISAYSLIIEEGTPFYERYGESWSEENEELDRQMYEDTKIILQQAGYQRYEISNYAKTGCESRHNTSYWTGIPYFGCGLGASSLLQTGNTWIRTRNETDLTVYLKMEEFSYVEMEELTLQAQMEEFMFLGLRLTRGIDPKVFAKRFPQAGTLEVQYGNVITELMQDGLLEYKRNRIALTDRGLDLSNYCFEKFLL